ncbi:MAG: type II toxin-antitoxin system VapC family toxin [Sporichthyaceae bacterium]
MSAVLVDTVIWIDHLRGVNAHLVHLLDEDRALGHPMVHGELALGSLPDRERTLALLAGLPQAVCADHDEVMSMVESRRLYGTGLSLIDAHLLAATLITPDAQLWTRDRRLNAAAATLSVAYP